MDGQNKKTIHHTFHGSRSNTLAFLSSGQSVDCSQVQFRRWGQAGKPLVLIMGGISAGRFVQSTEGHQGWWDAMCADDAVFNANDFQYLAFEYHTFSERLTNPPVITPEDQAQIIAQVHAELSLPPFHAVVGSSYGGLVALAFAAQYPDLCERLLVIGAADEQRVKVQATRAIQRQIIACALSADNPAESQQFTALARSLAMIGYRGEAEWERRFKGADPVNGLDALTRVSSYLNHHGEKFASRFSASRYYQLSQSIDHANLDVSQIQVETLLIGFESDEIAPPALMQKMANRFVVKPQLRIIPSEFGHDAFLLETTALNQIIQPFITENIHEQTEPNPCCASGY